MKKNFFLTIFFALPFFFFACAGQEKNNFKTIFVSRVYDGDTFFDNQNNSYRLFGIDTPEIIYNQNNLKINQDFESLYAKKAKKFVEILVLNKKIAVENIKKDKYQRNIAKIKVNNQDLAFLLVKEGLARVAYISLNKKSPFYTSDFSYYEKLLNYQYLAYKKDKGFWARKKNFRQIFPKS